MSRYEWKTDRAGNRRFVRTVDAPIVTTAVHVPQAASVVTEMTPTVEKAPAKPKAPAKKKSDG